MFVAFDEDVVEAVIEGNLEVSGCVVLGAGFEVIGFEHDVPQLQHGFDGNVVVKIVAGAAVDFLDDFGQFLVGFWRYVDIVRHRQGNNGVRHDGFFYIGGIEFLDEIGSLYLAAQIESAAAVTDIDKGQQAVDKSVFLMDGMVFETGDLDEEFIVFDKAFQQFHQFPVLIIFVMFHPFLHFIQDAGDARLAVAVLGV